MGIFEQAEIGSIIRIDPEKKESFKKAGFGEIFRNEMLETDLWKVIDKLSSGVRIGHLDGTPCKNTENSTGWKWDCTYVDKYMEIVLEKNLNIAIKFHVGDIIKPIDIDSML